MSVGRRLENSLHNNNGTVTHGCVPASGLRLQHLGFCLSNPFLHFARWIHRMGVKGLDGVVSIACGHWNSNGINRASDISIGMIGLPHNNRAKPQRLLARSWLHSPIILYSIWFLLLLIGPLLRSSKGRMELQCFLKSCFPVFGIWVLAHSTLLHLVLAVADH